MTTWEAMKPAPPVTRMFFGVYCAVASASRFCFFEFDMRVLLLSEEEDRRGPARGTRQRAKSRIDACVGLARVDAAVFDRPKQR